SSNEGGNSVRSRKRAASQPSLKRLPWTPTCPSNKQPTAMTRRSSSGESRCGLSLERARIEGRTMVFVDDSGVYLLPGLVRTYTLCGQTSVLGSVYAHGHLSVMSGITMDGGLYTLMRDEAPDSLDSVVFLSPLLPHVAEQLLLSSAGSPIHKEQMRTFL